jgi:polysaccharide biosynthesis protein PelG
VAGIGLHIGKMLERDSYAALLGAYGYAGVVSAGPWVLSIAGMLAIGVIAAGAAVPGRAPDLLVLITWSTAGSLIVTGPLQLVFGRFVADCIYERRHGRILPNLIGALELTTIASGVLASVAVLAFDESLLCRALLVATFVAFCDGWLLLVMLSGVKAHRAVVVVFAAAQLASIGGALALRRFGLEGLLFGFLTGQVGALFGMFILVARAFPGEQDEHGGRFDFLRPSRARLQLAAIGLLFYVGTWVDKVAFWLNPSTSTPAFGPLRASPLYDLPIFLAYLSAIPAVAVFFLRLEADFARRCGAFVRAVRDGAPLHRIEHIHRDMVACVRRGFVEILQVQGVTLVVILVAGPALLRAAGISPLHERLLVVDSAAVALQVVFLAILNVFFYLDERRPALVLIALFAAGNLVGTLVTQSLGPDWYGFGFATAAFLASAAGLPILSRKLERLDREIFMRQPLWPRAELDPSLDSPPPRRTS